MIIDHHEDLLPYGLRYVERRSMDKGMRLRWNSSMEGLSISDAASAYAQMGSKLHLTGSFPDHEYPGTSVRIFTQERGLSICARRERVEPWATRHLMFVGDLPCLGSLSLSRHNMPRLRRVTWPTERQRKGFFIFGSNTEEINPSLTETWRHVQQGIDFSSFLPLFFLSC